MKLTEQTNTRIAEHQHLNIHDISAILWDFNGTLLNDTQLCINSINILLTRRKLSTLDIETYREIFTFPVKNYYRKAGFKFTEESFEKPAMEFIELYNKKLSSVKLFKEVEHILEHFRKNNIQQYIISAMQQQNLTSAVENLGISKYFNDIRGISDHYANGKTERAKILIKENKLDPEKIWLIGDTLHDHEVAESLGCKSILIANGHQSRNRLESTGTIILDDLNELKTYLLSSSHS